MCSTTGIKSQYTGAKLQTNKIHWQHPQINHEPMTCLVKVLRSELWEML